MCGLNASVRDHVDYLNSGSQSLALNPGAEPLDSPSEFLTFGIGLRLSKTIKIGKGEFESGRSELGPTDSTVTLEIRDGRGANRYY